MGDFGPSSSRRISQSSKRVEVCRARYAVRLIDFRSACGAIHTPVLLTKREGVAPTRTSLHLVRAGLLNRAAPNSVLGSETVARAVLFICAHRAVLARPRMRR